MVSTPTDVLVVGAGPTGLLLAGDLAAAGISCTLLERRASGSNLTRAFGVHARSLEVLDARGLADELVATGTPIDRLRLFDRVHLDLSILPTRFPYLLITPQYHTERLLEERALAAGARIRRGAEVVDVAQDPDGVEARIRSVDGSTTTVRASYLVGTDGVHSRVREAVGLPFPGRSAVRSIVLADVRLTDPPADVLTVNGVGDAFAFLVPYGDGWYRVFAWDRGDQRPDDAPVELEEVREITRRALGTDHGMHDPRWLSRFHSDERQAPRYRVGRVLLAGDAAHCHSPAGGQGMNTGLQDAANLGWKLAATVQGWAPEGLLDTYQAERHPVGREVLRTSGTLLRLARLRPRPVRAARGLLGAAALGVGPIARRVTGAISGIGVRYPAPRGAHPEVGRRAADTPLTGGAGRAGRLYEALRAGRFVLLVPAGGRPVELAGWTDRVEVMTRADAAGTATLVRPDGYVAWVGKAPSSLPEETALRTALTDWCGAPVEEAGA